MTSSVTRILNVVEGTKQDQQVIWLENIEISQSCPLGEMNLLQDLKKNASDGSQTFPGARLLTVPDIPFAFEGCSFQRNTHRIYE